MVKKRSLPFYNVHEVTDRFEHWLRVNGSERGSPLEGVRLRVDGPYDLQREDLQIKSVVGGIPQLIWFSQNEDASLVDAEKNMGSFSFHVLLPGLKEEKIDELAEHVGSKRSKMLSRSELKSFGHIYGGQSYRMHSVPFQDDLYEGVCVDAQIKRLPLGREGRLSENLFVYGERGIARPARSFVFVTI